MLRLILLLLLCTHSYAATLAQDYRQFWLWAGVHPPSSILQHCDVLYVLQGEVSGKKSLAQLTIQGASPVEMPVSEMWLVWRVQRLDWSPTVLASIVKRIQLWQQKHNPVVGIQLDFDARTPQLANYGQFLRNIRQQLPPDIKISITGLLDWTQTGDVNTLNQLDGVINELVVQTYRGRITIPNYAQYLGSLKKLQIPFKIGLVEGGEWDNSWQTKLYNPFYRGEVVFLLNSPYKNGSYN